MRSCESCSIIVSSSIFIVFKSGAKVQLFLGLVNSIDHKMHPTRNPGHRVPSRRGVGRCVDVPPHRSDGWIGAVWKGYDSPPPIRVRVRGYAPVRAGMSMVGQASADA